MGDIGGGSERADSCGKFVAKTGQTSSSSGTMKNNYLEEDGDDITRRHFARLIGGTAAMLLLQKTGANAQTAAKTSATAALLTRAIPSSGEKIPVIGLGTSRVFDAGSSAADRQPLEEVLALLVKHGGKLVDTSPMYGRAEAVTGEIAAKLKLRDSLFLATKVWTTGRDAGIKQMERSLELLGTKKLDLIQVHNLIDLETQLATLREWKKAGRIGYTGITHSRTGSQAEVASILEKEPVDFVQINYSLMEREADERVFPVAKDRGVAVIVNRPFGRGDLFDRVRGKALPDWAAQIDCKSWAQFFLKWIVANPVVTCAIPATSKPRHMEDNMQACHGRLPDEKMRQRMAELVTTF
jgi:diketogulonate reductase-like aldo/keto reductase